MKIALVCFGLLLILVVNFVHNNPIDGRPKSLAKIETPRRLTRSVTNVRRNVGTLRRYVRRYVRTHVCTGRCARQALVKLVQGFWDCLTSKNL